MADNSHQLVQKLWNYCNILRDDGLSYGDYVEQLTFLLFLKMADEQSRAPFNKPSPIPEHTLIRCSAGVKNGAIRTLRILQARDARMVRK